MISRIGKRKNKGFLLLEAMVSVVILSIALALILNSFIRSVRAIELSEDYFRATLLLEDKIFEIHNTEIKEGSTDGKFSNFGTRFSWHLDVVRLEDIPLYEINLEVSWNQGSRPKDLSIMAYLKVRS